MDRNEIEEWIKKLEGKASFFESAHGAYDLENASLLRGSVTALRHLLQAMRWRPISEAPKDGTPVLLWAPDYFESDPHPIVGEWCDRVGAWDSPVGMMEDDPICSDDPEVCNGPTHFMPLPQPPSTDEERSSATPSEQQNEREE